MTDELLAAALRYTQAGWPVFPCKPGRKEPLTIHGCLDATTDPNTIITWWRRVPTANIGIACGTPGPDVVDFDVKHDAPGATTYARLRDAGLLAGALAVVTTPSGGWHLYYQGTTQGNGADKQHGVDFRGRGGYVLAPPSCTSAGGYELRESRPGATTVDWQAIRRLLSPPKPARPRPATSTGAPNHDALVRRVAACGEGERNNLLFWAACKAAEEAAPEQVYADLVGAAVGAGLPEHEATRTVDSARRRGGAR